MIKMEKIVHDITRLFPELVEELREEKDVVAVYLFGSYASGRAGPLSDVDVAVLLDETNLPIDYFDRELELLGKANHALRTDEVSFVLLNKVPLTMQYGVLKESKLLYSKDEIKRVRFETKVFDCYLDFALVLRGYDKILFSKIKEGCFYGG